MCAKSTGCCAREGCSSSRCRARRWEAPRSIAGWASGSRRGRHAKWRNAVGLNCATSTVRASNITGYGISSGEFPDIRHEPGGLTAGAGRIVLLGIAAAGPVFAHALRNLLSFLGIHGFAAPALNRLGRFGHGPGVALEFLE